MTSLETIKLLLSLRELILRNLRLQNLLDKLPELLVFVVEKHDQTSGLRVETAGDVLDGMLSDFLDTGVRDGEFVRELVDGAAVLDGVEEVCG